MYGRRPMDGYCPFIWIVHCVYNRHGDDYRTMTLYIALVTLNVLFMIWYKWGQLLLVQLLYFTLLLWNSNWTQNECYVIAVMPYRPTGIFLSFRLLASAVRVQFVIANCRARVKVKTPSYGLLLLCHLSVLRWTMSLELRYVDIDTKHCFCWTHCNNHDCFLHSNIADK